MNASRRMALPSVENEQEWTARGINMQAARQRSLFIATPVYDKLDLSFHISSVVTGDLLKKLGIPYELGFVRGVPVTDARNMLVSQFLASGKSDMLFIDCDQGSAPLDVVRLPGHGLPLVGAVGRKKIHGPDSDANLWCFEPLKYPFVGLSEGDGVDEVAGIGAGMMMINRCVFDLLKAAHPEWERDPITPNEGPYVEYFACDLVECSRRRISEDMTFCKRYRDIGGHIFADMSISFVHYGQVEFGGSVSPAEALKDI